MSATLLQQGGADARLPCCHPGQAGIGHQADDIGCKSYSAAAATSALMHHLGLEAAWWVCKLYLSNSTCLTAIDHLTPYTASDTHLPPAIPPCKCTLLYISLTQSPAGASQPAVAGTAAAPRRVPWACPAVQRRHQAALASWQRLPRCYTRSTAPLHAPSNPCHTALQLLTNCATQAAR